MKRTLAMILASALMLSCLTACGGTKEEKPAADDSKPAASDAATAEGDKPFDGVVLSAMILQSQNWPGMQLMMDKFTEETGVTFDAQVIPDEQFVSLLQTKIATNSLPDIMQYNVPHIYNIIDEEMLYDFIDEPWVSELIDPTVSQKDGGQYTFPFVANTGYQCIIYNTDVFADNGVEIPTTKAEFDAACETIRAAGIDPILISSDMWVPQIWTDSGFARAMGTEEAALEMSEKLFSGQADFNDYPELAAVLDDLIAFTTNKYTNADIATMTWDDAWVRLAAGEGAMLMGEAFMIGQNADKFPDANFSVFNYPGAYDTTDCLGGAKFSTSLAASADSENIEAIKLMFNKFSTPEYLDLFFTEGNAGFPAFEGVDGGDLQPEIVELYNKYQEKGTIIPGMNTAWAAMEPLFNDYLWTYYMEALVKGNLTGEEILDKYQKDFDKFQKQNGVEGF